MLQAYNYKLRLSCLLQSEAKYPFLTLSADLPISVDRDLNHFDLKRRLIEGGGLPLPALVPIKLRQVLAARDGFGVLGSQRFFQDLERPVVKWLCLCVFALAVVKSG